LSRFAQSLLREWMKLDLSIKNANAVVAVSGGADSVALLLSLNELIQADKLKIEILVAHLNHRLRGKASEADARWVASLAKRLGRKAAIGSIDVKRRAAKTSDNLVRIGSIADNVSKTHRNVPAALCRVESSGEGCGVRVKIAKYKNAHSCHPQNAIEYR